MSIERAVPGLSQPGMTPEGGGFLGRWSRDPRRWFARINFLLFALLVTGGLTLIQVVDWPVRTNLQVAENQISDIDVRAPRTVTYRSEILTEEARDREAAAVRPIYDPPQTRIARQQLGRAELILDYIQVVRNDLYATTAQRVEWLRNIAEVPLTEETAQLILDLSEERWQLVANDVGRVLDLSMRREIREGELETARRTVPGLIAFGLTDDEAQIVRSMVQGLMRPNAFYNAERTQEERDRVVAEVEPVERTIAAGETILRSGDRIDPIDIEALDVLGLLQSERTWFEYGSALLLAALLTTLLMIFIMYRRYQFWSWTFQVYLLAGIILGFAFVGKLMLGQPGIVALLFPVGAMAMLIGALIDLPIAIFAVLIMTILTGQFTTGDMQSIVFVAAGGVTGALALGKAERLNSFVRAGIWVIIANLVVLAAYSFSPIIELDGQNLLQLSTAAIVNGIFASSFTLVIFYMLGQVFGLTTSLQLLELSRPTHPLLRQLLLKAPGTYHHTLLVSNLAEEAATAIGADVLLARVGSYYHDIGKTVRPYFFIENSTDGSNPHDRLDPYTSARIVISHVSDGVDLATKYRLPQAVVDFIREHHGTTRVEYFYHQATQEFGSTAEVDESAFRYPGPRPRSRETAILMLADGSEAIVRAMNPPTRIEMAELIRSVINRRLLSGQLDDSQLTLQDLNKISEAFVRVLQGIHHPRVRYPSDAQPTTPARQEPAKAVEALPAG